MRASLHIARGLAALALALPGFATAARADSAAGPAIHAIPMVASPSIEPRAVSVRATAHAGPAALDALPASVAAELSRAAPFPSAQVFGSRYRAVSNCSAESAELTTPLVASGQVALRISGLDSRGRPCQAYAFVDVRVTTDALVAARPIREGVALEGSVRLVRREILRGESPLTSLPAGVTASRSLATGQLIQLELLRAAGLAPGSPVRVMVQEGALSLEEDGHVVRCNQVQSDRACAVVASGKRVEGSYLDGVILVESP